VNSFLIGKEGASLNYCLDWQLALCPLTGVFVVLLSRIWAEQSRTLAIFRVMLLSLAAVTAVQLVVLAAVDCNQSIGLTGAARRELNVKRQEDLFLIRMISSMPGPVVSENMTLLLRAGKAIPFEPAIIRQTTRTGIFDERDLLKQMSDGYFDAIILRTSLDHGSYFSPRMLHAIQTSYQRYPFKGNDYVVFLRR
jgi:hypothetical protein